jgi:hypothetical protein
MEKRITYKGTTAEELLVSFKAAVHHYIAHFQGNLEIGSLKGLPHETSRNLFCHCFTKPAHSLHQFFKNPQ